METSQELRHWGIKGQKWGIRRYENPDGTLTEAGKKRYRYQNPDGSLTEEGKKDYMKAAKNGKLDVSKLSDNDLNMINLRFAREKTFKQNVKEYEDSKFSNRLKKAVIDRIKGSGGGGKSKNKSGVASLLAMPIKKAFEEAFKEGNGGGNGNDNGNSKDEDVFTRGKRFVSGGLNKSISDFANMNDRVTTGKRFMGEASTRSDQFGDVKTWNPMKRSVEDTLRNRRSQSQSPIDRAKADRKVTSTKKKKRRQNNARHADYNDGIYFIISRNSSDELCHHGIIGQKWGVRRYQNPDGTLTEAGKARIAQTAGYGYLNPTYKDIKKGKAKNRYSVSKEYDDKFWKNVSNGMRTDEPTKEGKKLWDGFKDQYASATLKDLKMKITPQAIREVKRLLAQIDPSYSYTHKVKDDNGDYEDRRNERFKQRRQMIEHPIKMKASKAANKTIDTAAKLAPIIKTLT